VDDSGSSGLKPAEIEPGALRKLRRAIASFWFGELWALAFGSGLWWYLGLIHNASPLIGVAGAGVCWCLATGDRIEEWLAILSGEPLLNEQGELDSIAPSKRAVAYVFPPLVATFGVFGILAGTAIIPLVTCGVSLAIFAYLMRRIWRVRTQYVSTLSAKS
jgi:hypothetical protein